MDNFIEAAFRYAILSEKKSHDFYCQMTRTVSDNGIKSLFNQLARDAADHLKTFVLRYPGDEFELLALVNSPQARDPPADPALVAAVPEGKLSDRHALEISLSEERDCLERYTAMVLCIREPELRTLFELALEDSRRHYTAINEAYVRFSETPAPSGKLSSRCIYPSLNKEESYDYDTNLS